MSFFQTLRDRNDSTVTSKVILYIDNSNIFESARKRSTWLNKYRNGIPDVACRINIGKLEALAVANREVLVRRFYGSEPKPIDSVWNAIRKKQYDVKIFKRSTWTWKEKQVDASLIADAVEDLILQKDKGGQGRTVIIFSGDADLLPLVDKAISHGYKVEIWGFKTTTNAVVKARAKVEANLEFFDIGVEHIFKEISFKEYLWGRRIPEERSLITSISLPLNTHPKTFFQEFVEAACTTFRLPMNGKYLTEGTDHYIVLVPCVREHYLKNKIRMYDFDEHVMGFTHMLEEYYQSRNITIKFQTWFKFLQSRRQALGHDNNISLQNHFDVMTMDDYEGVEEEDEDEEGSEISVTDDESYLTEDEDGAKVEQPNYYPDTANVTFAGLAGFSSFGRCPGNFTLADFMPAVRKETKEKIVIKLDCKFGFCCGKGRSCSYVHTKEQEKFFDIQRDPQKRAYYKIGACNLGIGCPHRDTPYLCGFAHNFEESRCFICQQHGNWNHCLDFANQRTKLVRSGKF